MNEGPSWESYTYRQSGFEDNLRLCAEEKPADYIFLSLASEVEKARWWRPDCPMYFRWQWYAFECISITALSWEISFLHRSWGPGAHFRYVYRMLTITDIFKSSLNVFTSKSIFYGKFRQFRQRVRENKNKKSEKRRVQRWRITVICRLWFPAGSLHLGETPCLLREQITRSKRRELGGSGKDFAETHGHIYADR